MTARRERPIAEVDMPQALILLDGAALGTPLLLFCILIWTSLERRLELAEKERLVRGRVMQSRVAAAAALTLVAVAPASAIGRGRTA